MNTREQDDIQRFLELLFEPGDVFEVRAPNCRDGTNGRYTFTASGYFSHSAMGSAVEATSQIDESATAPGVYVTLNPVSPALMARSTNRIRPRAKETTQDKDIVCRRWLLIDLDPVRPAGVSATGNELAMAAERSGAVRKHLAESGWPSPVVAMSGNGYHLLYRVDLPGNDGGLVKRVLDALAQRFDDGKVAVDRSVHNPARIVKVIGTYCRKGDDLRDIPDVEDRPHRRATFVDVPEQVDIVPEKLLRAVAGDEELASNRDGSHVHWDAALDDRIGNTPESVRSWLEARGAAVKGERRNGDKTMLLLERCPVDPEIVSTGGSDIAVLVGDNGKLAYCNRHNRGLDYRWQDVRKALDPGYVPLVMDDPGVDLSEFDPRKPGKDVIKPLPVQKLLSRYPMLRPPIIEGLLRRGETMNVIAPPKTGKSWLVLALAMAVATGRRWLDAFETVPGNVLIVDNELHSETLSNRIPKVAEAMDIGLDVLSDRVCVQSLRGQLKDIFSTAAYLETLEPGQFDLIVLDAFYRFMPTGMDENDNGGMANIYNRLDSVADRLGCALVLIHHTSKGNQSTKSVTDVGAGAGSQSRATDTHLVLRAHQEPGAYVLDAAVRSWPPAEPIVLRREHPIWTPGTDLDPTDLLPERPKRAKPAAKKMEKTGTESPWTVERFVEEFLTDEPAPPAELRHRAKSERDLSGREVHDLLVIGERSGEILRVTLPGRGGPVGYIRKPREESE